QEIYAEPRAVIEQQATLVEAPRNRSEEHTSELQSLTNLVCRLLLEKKYRDRFVPHALRLQLLAVCAVVPRQRSLSPCFFFNDAAPSGFHPLPLPDALPI